MLGPGRARRQEVELLPSKKVRRRGPDRDGTRAKRVLTLGYLSQCLAALLIDLWTSKVNSKRKAGRSAPSISISGASRRNSARE